MLASLLGREVRILFAWAAVAAVVPAAAAEAPSVKTAAEKIKQALAQSRDLEIADEPLDAAVNQLREQTGINLVIDQAAVPALAVKAVQAGVPGMPVPSPYAHLRVTVHSAGRPVREALAKALRPHGLVVVVVGDSALITPADRAAERQLGQAIHLDADALPLKDVLQRLARDTGANVMLDQRLTKEGQTAVRAQLDDVPLETAVEVVADQAGLKAVRLSNVLYVTTEARAEKLHRPPVAAAAAGGWQVWPDGAGGFRLTPPPGVVPGGLLGFSGMGGIVGNGTGPAVGMLGVGGGALGIAGIGGGGAGPRVPPPPPAKPAPPKPKTETPPTPPKADLTPGGPAAPPPPDKKPDPASGPRPSKPRSGRKPRVLPRKARQR
jgi:uncharacterized protein YaiI (UPF0178 family)